MEVLYVFAAIPFAVWSLGLVHAAAFAVLFVAFAILFSEDIQPETFALFVLINLVLLGLTVWSFGSPLWHFVNSIDFVWFIIEYLIIGGVYAFFRWWLYCKNAAEQVLRNKDSLLAKFNAYNRPGETFKDYLVEWDHIPVANKNKYRIFNWVFVWPVSMLRWSLTDLTRALADAVVHMFGGVFNRISYAVFHAAGFDDKMLNRTSEMNEKKD